MPNAPSLKRHLVVALPHRNAAFFDHTAMLVCLGLACAEKGIELILCPETTNPYSVALDICLAKFMALPAMVDANPGDEWQMLVLDDDTAIDVPTLMKLVDAPYALKGIAYRKKTGADNRTSTYVLSSRAWPAPSADGFTELDRVGGGCLLVRREAVLRMAEKHPHLAYAFHHTTHLGLFREHYEPGWVSPDYAFCDRAREAGIDTFVLVDAKTTHWGIASWTGNLAEDYGAFVEEAKKSGDHEHRNFEVRKESVARDPNAPRDLGEIYSTAFFDTFFDAVPEYAMAAKGIVDTIGPTKVLDVGCGPGLMIGALRDAGVEAWGFDGSPNARATAPEAVKPFIDTRDILNAIGPLDPRTETVVCTEVAEHLPESQADALVECLDRATASTLVFTAAHEGQPGHDHINCQPPGYWIAKLAARGLALDADATARLKSAWAPLKRLWFFPANALVFRRQDVATVTRDGLGAVVDARSVHVEGVTP